MLDGMPAGALFKGYADPTGLDMVSGPSDEEIMNARRMQAIMEARRREEALAQAAAEQARRDSEMARSAMIVTPSEVPRGFPSEDPRDQLARYQELMGQLNQAYPVQPATDPIQDAVDREMLQRRLDGLRR